MANTHLLSLKPLAIAAKHTGFSFLSLGVAMLIIVGAIQVLGKVEDAGPRAMAVVPKYQPPASKVAPVVEKPEPPAALAWLPWRLPDGAMTPWMPGTPPPKAPEGGAPISPEEAARLAAEATAKGEPVPTSVLAASAADAIPPVSGNARIMAPQFGEAAPAASSNIEAGVRVVRGGVRSAPLSQAPAAGVHQSGPNGVLPIIGPGGRTVFDAYRKPFSDTGKPKIALVVGGLGLNARITQRAIDELPAEVTLSFVPYAENLQGWINKARAGGHEVLIEIPMEPFDYPDNDPGPHTLLSIASAEENQRRLEFLLSRATGYFGVTNYLGGKFAGGGSAVGALMRSLRGRGIGFISDGSASGLGTAAENAGMRNAQADRSLDQRPSGEDIAAQLGALEVMATQRGAALGFGVAYSVTIDQIVRWSRDATRRGLVLAPASAVMS
jgi:polysaccharide deacetylase 2 family uncharacterized protein YibQ